MATQARLTKRYHCVYALHYRLVVVTEQRRRCLTAAMLERLREIGQTRCAGWGGELLELNGGPDHVHLLVSLPPSAELSGFVNNLKTTSSRLLRKEFAEDLNRVFRKPVLWSRSYCIVTRGGAPLSTLRRYIEQQGRPE